MHNFTPTQGRYLSFISAYIDGFGLPPAESEIGEALEVSAPSVNRMMKMLEKLSLIRRQAGVARSIEILVVKGEIPEWTGKRLTRTVMGRVKINRRAKKVVFAAQSLPAQPNAEQTGPEQAV